MLSPDKIFEHLNQNKDGKLSFGEFAYAVLSPYQEFSQEETQMRCSWFNEMDVNGDGEINASVFVSWFERKLKGLFGVRDDVDGDGKITAKELHLVMTQIGRTCTEESCAEKIRAIDIDSNGLLNFEVCKAILFGDPF